VVVENRPGGGGGIGAHAVAKSPADGYTLLLASSTFAAHPALFPKAPYDMRKDFTPIVKIVDGPILIAVHPSVPVSTLKDLLDYAKKQPGGLAYGTAGVASTPHLAGEYLKVRTGANLVHVPFKGDAPAVTALLGGSIPMAVTGLASSMPHIRAGRIRPIAVTTAKRQQGLPDTPAANEVLPGFELAGWYSILAPAGVPAAIVDSIASAVTELIEHPEVRDRLGAMGLTVEPLGPAQFKEYFASEIQRLSEVVHKANITVD
jgi:tripartite-type tricarboxylate transporter receptor subunit TctC